VTQFFAHFLPCPADGKSGTGNCVQPFPTGGLNAGDVRFIQWRARYDSNMVNHANFLGPDSDGVYRGHPVQNWGFKFSDIGLADTPRCIAGSQANSIDCPTSCPAQGFEQVYTGGFNNSSLLAYVNCAGPFSFQGLYGDEPGGQWTIQNLVTPCTNVDGYAGCLKIFPNEWLTFKMRIKMGHFNQFDNEMTFWYGREGQPLVKIIECTAAQTNKCDFSFGPGTANNGIPFTLLDPNTGQQISSGYQVGKLYISPYTTSLVETVQNASMWYDELIISTQDIADPGSSLGPQTTPTAPANLTVK
jgi:hypothetical protein